MELAQLEAFLQVAHHRSFSRAAEALFLTQPSVTARIQSLERELGERLFERSGRSVSLTDAGIAFIPHAQRALTAVQEGADAIDAVRHGEVGSIRIGASSSIGTYNLPDVLERFRDIRPGVHVNLTTGQTEEVVERLLSGLIHIAICRLTQHPEFESIHLYNDKLRLVVPTNHPFVGKTAVTLTDAADEPFLFFDRNSSYHTLVYTMFLRAGVAPESVMEVDSMEVIKRMVERGLGIAVLPEVSVQDEVQRGDLATIELAGTEQPVREVGLHVLRNRMMAPPIGDFLQLMAEHYGLDRTFEAGHTPAESR
ncbi:MAG: LysR family transcriptional regulator [Dehalococcoidia bacterium]|nr:LysR family transcriptional regulator [Dehalococcoidia bacterium]MCA9852734.1 LysR family transcriptional regulator [Dehalococcoidia bacterium]